MKRFTNVYLHKDEEKDNLQPDPGLAEGLDLVPLVGDQVGSPYRHWRLLFLSL